jgi:protoporphyrinogen oxidase
MPVNNRSLNQNSETWAIVGGGFLGLTLALRLAQAGRRVKLYEEADSIGGLAGAWTLGEVVWDKHYHVTLLSDTYTRGIVNELGLADEFRWVETKTGFYTGGQLYSMSNTLEFLKFPPLGLLDKIRLGGNIFYASKVKNWRRLEQISVADWLRRWSGKRTFERMWRPLLRAKLGESYTKVSAAFIWATIARMYAARRTGLKKEMFGYVRGGYARVLKRFAEKLVETGVEVKLNHRLERVEQHGAKFALSFANGANETFDQVVLTIPSSVAAQVCPQLNDAEKAKLNGVEYQGIVCASVLLKESLGPYYVTNITDAFVPFTAVIEMSALVDKAEFGGHALIYLPKYVAPDDPVFAESDDAIKARFLSALAQMYPHFHPKNDVITFQLSRVRQVFPLPTVNYSAKLPAQTTSRPGLHIINSAHILNGTLNVNETVQLAENAAARLLAN